jgi:hypothetical protein
MIDWGRVLVGQLEFYWDVHLRPRLEGLTDAEYVWEPVGGCWTLRRQKSGTWVLDGKWPGTLAAAGDNDCVATSPRRRRLFRHARNCVL